MLRLNRRQLLHFYDEWSDDHRIHSSAINGVIGEDLGLGLLLHYFGACGVNSTVLSGTPRVRGRRGPWLDAWVQTESSTPKLYQVEIKNWCAHSVGGKQLLVDAPAPAVTEYKRARWREEWDINRLRFTNDRVDKVLTRMQSPSPNLPVEPLVVYWFAVHPDGDEQPFFQVAASGDFDLVNVFSMSAYLRILEVDQIDITETRAVERLRLLGSLASVVSAG